jgi:hypothetical protein
MTQVVEHLPSKYKALISGSTNNNNKKKQKKKPVTVTVNWDMDEY